MSPWLKRAWRCQKSSWMSQANLEIYHWLRLILGDCQRAQCPARVSGLFLASQFWTLADLKSFAGRDTDLNGSHVARINQGDPVLVTFDAPAGVRSLER